MRRGPVKLMKRAEPRRAQDTTARTARSDASQSACSPIPGRGALPVNPAAGLPPSSCAALSGYDSLRKRFLNHLAMHVRQPHVPTAEAEGEALVVDAQQV